MEEALKKAAEENANNKDSNEKKKSRAITAAILRLHKDLDNLCIPECCVLDIKPSHLDHFHVYIVPEHGYYAGGAFCFSFKITDDYPFEPPIVKCLDIIFHPNIDVHGAICLNILRLDWKPVFDISYIIVGLLNLFLEPTPFEPLNKVAGKLLEKSPRRFARTVSETMKGISCDGIYYTTVYRKKYGS